MRRPKFVYLIITKNIPDWFLNYFREESAIQYHLGSAKRHTLFTNPSSITYITMDKHDAST